MQIEDKIRHYADKLPEDFRNELLSTIEGLNKQIIDMRKAEEEHADDYFKLNDKYVALRKQAEGLKGEVERLKSNACVIEDISLRRKTELEKRREEVEKYRTALEWYADEENYSLQFGSFNAMLPPKVLEDNGDTANKALEGSHETP